MPHVRRFASLTSLIPIAFLAACASGPIAYSFHSPSLAEPDVALVKVHRKMGSPAVLLARVDGVDPLKHKAMEGHRPQGLERYEPRLISVSPGEHTFVVQVQLTDLIGKVISDEIFWESAMKYSIPEHKTEFGKPDFATLMHSETISFNALRGGYYLLQYRWDKSAKELVIFVEQCAKDWLNCTPYQFATSNAKTKFVLGMGWPAE